MTSVSATSSATGPQAAGASLQPGQTQDQEKLHKAAQAFEAIFVRQMLSTARSSNFGSDLFSSQAADTFKSMQDERFADIAAKSGALGFAKVIEAQLAKHVKIADGGTPTNGKP